MESADRSNPEGWTKDIRVVEGAKGGKKLARLRAFAFGRGKEKERNKLGARRSDFQLRVSRGFFLGLVTCSPGKRKRRIPNLKRGLLLIASCLTSLVSRHPWPDGRTAAGEGKRHEKLRGFAR